MIARRDRRDRLEHVPRVRRRRGFPRCGVGKQSSPGRPESRAFLAVRALSRFGRSYRDGHSATNFEARMLWSLWCRKPASTSNCSTIARMNGMFVALAASLGASDTQRSSFASTRSRVWRVLVDATSTEEPSITSCTAQVLSAANPEDDAVLEQLRADPVIEFIDHREEQLEELRRLRPPPDPELVAEPCRWAYYPWRRTVVAVLGPRAFRAVRLDRNRNLITAEEQARLGSLRIGVAGLSVGHIIAHTLAAQGMCGELRLADFDPIALSNLNRVPATLLDLGLNKAEVAARRIAELDPYLLVRVLDVGLTVDNVDEFLDGLDLVVEECDSLDMKASLRERARARRIPVLMATSDRGLVDVERFDLEPQRPILHGLLGDLDFARLSDLSSREMVPHMLRFLEADELSPRVLASAVEIDQTLSTWPQVSGEVVLGATAIAEAVRRFGLGKDLRAGRTRIDVASARDRLP